MTKSLKVLADEIGTLDAEIKYLQSKLDELKSEAKALGRDEIVGNLFSVKITKSIAATLDTASLKKEYGQSWYDDHCKLGERTTVYIKPLPSTLASL